MNEMQIPHLGYYWTIFLYTVFVVKLDVIHIDTHNCMSFFALNSEEWAVKEVREIREIRDSGFLSLNSLISLYSLNSLIW